MLAPGTTAPMHLSKLPSFTFHLHAFRAPAVDDLAVVLQWQRLPRPGTARTAVLSVSRLFQHLFPLDLLALHP